MVSEAIDDVLAEEDPRKAVLAAWARLERVLEAGGAPRRDSETPFEFSARAAAELALSGPILDRLARLFEWARFSVNEVTPEMREHSLAALQAIREDLRRFPRDLLVPRGPESVAT